ncbi:hypothetical protein MATL_G00100380 [Megalops atlanticus]|uniref:Reverse transcriptase domain-containing protein n=1 Tax=Megalops atlanticus TaxID=7932 RepID=A0A9D3TAH6_MEGAT|nr:hypothetical protein MATL_G00100380 [Megalops atlanticus]
MNGVLGDLIPQAAGDRQACPLSPLLYVLYMEPFAAAVRADPYVDRLHIPGSSGSMVKITQYADDTTLFLTSDLALQRALDFIGSFGRAAGTFLNCGKTQVKYFSKWKGRQDVLGGLALCEGPLQVLGMSFLSEGAAHLNWRERLGAASRKLALWKARSLSFKGWPWFIARIPPQTSNAALLKHRTLYAEMRTEPGTRAIVGIDNEVWERVQPKALDHRLQDLNWLCVHSRLPVKDVLYRHKLTRHPFCPHPTCMGEETLSHAFWDCGFAKEVWTRTEHLLRALDCGFVLDYDKLIRGWDARCGKKDTDFLLLLVISLTKKKMWDCRELLVKKNVIPSAAGVCSKVFFDLKFRVRKDVAQWGYLSAREKWKGLFTLLQ